MNLPSTAIVGSHAMERWKRNGVGARNADVWSLDPSSAPTGDAYSVQYLGREREPLVLIDEFTGRMDELVRIARKMPYEPVQGYPGVRCRLSSMYLAPRLPLLRRILLDHFNLPGGAKVESCSFSIVDKRPEDLAKGQRRPHYDATDPHLIALLHFTGDASTGGTAFYRHRRTGFETIQPGRVQQYKAAVATEESELGAYPPRYFHGDDERYEMIGEVEAKPDRVIIYRGRLLHSGHIPIDPDPATARERGRLTINTFLIGSA